MDWLVTHQGGGPHLPEVPQFHVNRPLIHEGHEGHEGHEKDTLRRPTADRTRETLGSSFQVSLGNKKQNVGLFLGGQEKFFIETKEKTS